jgi:hypothetical protein
MNEDAILSENDYDRGNTSENKRKSVMRENMATI